MRKSSRRGRLLPGFEPETDASSETKPETKPETKGTVPFSSNENWDSPPENRDSPPLIPGLKTGTGTSPSRVSEATCVERLGASPRFETPAPSVAPQSLAGQTVWVVDSHSLIHQVFHALPEMTSPRGEPVAAVYGFARDLLYLLENKKPDFLFCAFDLPGKTFRHEIYEQYKIGRPAMHEDLVPQIADGAIAWSRPWAFPCSARVVRGRRRAGHRRPDRPTSWAAGASSSPATRTAGN